MAARSLPTPPPRPLIGINTDFYAPKNGPAFSKLNAAYFEAVLNAGGLPILIPPFQKENYAEIETILDLLSGVVMTGGLDLDPRRNGMQITNAVQPMAARREDCDRFVLSRVVERKLPLLAIGAGMQLLNVYFGGTLYLHLPADNPKALPHFDPSGGPHRHMVTVEPRTTLEDIFGAPELRVNSTHHQGINQIGKRLRVAAKSADGVIEAIETTDDEWFCIGLQWHPECDTASALDRQIFECFVQSAGQFAEEPMLAVA